MFPYKLYFFNTNEVDSIYLIYIISISFYKLQEKYKYCFFIFSSLKRDRSQHWWGKYWQWMPIWQTRLSNW